jgi:hypothetical protein
VFDFSISLELVSRSQGDGFDGVGVRAHRSILSGPRPRIKVIGHKSTIFIVEILYVMSVYVSITKGIGAER